MQLAVRPQANVHQNDYQVLRRILAEAGLFQRQPLYYTGQFAIAASLMVTSIVLVMTVDSFWLLAPAAVLMAAASGQLGFLGHDLGHRQVFPNKRYNDWVMLSMLPFVGVSPGWWRDAHNRHHSTPNDLQRDPHTTIPVFAFSEDQARSKRGLLSFIIRYQALYFVPLCMLSILGTKANGVDFIVRRKVRYGALEATGVLLHVFLYGALLLSSMPLTEAIAFAAIHHVFTGFYFGMIFAPNHKGMPIFSDDDRPDFLRSQVITSRNMYPHPVTDFLFGGLNYQIEHHLFPTMPRNKLRQARPLVQSFCRREGITYYETSVLQSYREVFGHLQRIGQARPLPLQEAGDDSSVPAIN